MPKRSWVQTYESSEGLTPSCPLDAENRPSSRQRQGNDTTSSGKNGEDVELGGQSNAHGSSDLIIPTLSRKIKACAACRRQKIKCLIDEDGPPCRRCAKHHLDCVVTKNLQTIIDEKQQCTDAIVEDLHHIHAVLRGLVRKVGLPDPNVLHTSVIRKSKRSSLPIFDGGYPTTLDAERNATDDHPDPHHDLCDNQHNDYGPSRDKSPELSADEDSSLPHVPIQSLYALTKLKSLRSPGNLNNHPSPSGGDFIARGTVSEDDAERLFASYRDRLDGFIYGIGCRYGRYASLKEMRSRSPILATTILTVAALHDPRSNDIYATCNAELRRLISLAIFDRNTSRDDLRAMCVASYWLSDISWMISGHAIRRASECDLHNQHSLAVEQNSDEAADGARLWFILRVCDQRLATLYGRPAIVHEDSSINEIESFLQSPVANAQDRRLMGQVALLSIFKSIRELFGPDKGKPIHRAYLHQISHFNKQLDNWVNYWSETVNDSYDHIGAFPRKAVRLHFHFAKLHLNSHVFRGLSAGQPIPHYFLDCTTSAICSATSTIDFILSDADVSAVVVGIPSYLHCMTAFACMFLIKVALKYGRDLIEPDYVWNLTTRLVQHFRTVPAGNWHLTKLMAPGLERMASMLDPTKGGISQPLIPAAGANALGTSPSSLLDSRGLTTTNSFLGFEGDFFFDYNMNLGLSPIFPLDFGGVPGADGQNMTLQ